MVVSATLSEEDSTMAVGQRLVFTAHKKKKKKGEKKVDLNINCTFQNNEILHFPQS